MTPTPDQVAAALAEHVRKDMAALPGRHNTLRAGILVPLVWRGELECVLTERCAKLRHHGGEVWIQVDGGVSARTIEQCADAGADVFVAGSAVYGAASAAAAIDHLRDLVSRH